MRKRLFISGISGFIGYELALRAIECGYEVGGLVRQSYRRSRAIDDLKGKVVLYEGSLNDYARVCSVVSDFNPDYVAHLGAITPVSYSFEHPWEVINTNLLGTVNLCEALKKYVPSLKRFVFASSMETYGHQPELHKKFIPFTEDTPQNAACPYAVAKIGAETYVRYLSYAYGFPGVSLRQTNTYGRKFNDYFVVEAFITSMLCNKEVVNFGNPKPVRNFLYISDLVDLYLSIFMYKKNDIDGESYCTGPPNGIDICTLADYISGVIGWEGKINWNTRELRDGEIFYLNSSNCKASKTFGWRPKVELVDGLSRCVSYWKDVLGDKSCFK
jgi:dTDP-glucose 4,6-dehydratase